MVKEGWLRKSDPYGANWKLRYCVLMPTSFYYYDHSDKRDSNLKGAFELRMASLSLGNRGTKKAPTPFGFSVTLTSRSYHFCTSSEADLAGWTDALARVLDALQGHVASPLRPPAGAAPLRNMAAYGGSDVDISANQSLAAGGIALRAIGGAPGKQPGASKAAFQRAVAATRPGTAPTSNGAGASMASAAQMAMAHSRQARADGLTLQDYTGLDGGSSFSGSAPVPASPALAPSLPQWLQQEPGALGAGEQQQAAAAADAPSDTITFYVTMARPEDGEDARYTMVVKRAALPTLTMGRVKRNLCRVLGQGGLARPDGTAVDPGCVTLTVEGDGTVLGNDWTAHEMMISDGTQLRAALDLTAPPLVVPGTAGGSRRPSLAGSVRSTRSARAEQPVQPQLLQQQQGAEEEELVPAPEEAVDGGDAAYADESEAPLRADEQQLQQQQRRSSQQLPSSRVSVAGSESEQAALVAASRTVSARRASSIVAPAPEPAPAAAAPSPQQLARPRLASAPSTASPPFQPQPGQPTSALSGRILGISAKLDHRMRVRRIFTQLAEEAGFAHPTATTSPGAGPSDAAAAQVDWSELAAGLGGDPDVCAFPEYEGLIARLLGGAAPWASGVSRIPSRFGAPSVGGGAESASSSVTWEEVSELLRQAQTEAEGPVRASALADAAGMLPPTPQQPAPSATPVKGPEQQAESAHAASPTAEAADAPAPAHSAPAPAVLTGSAGVRTVVVAVELPDGSTADLSVPLGADADDVTTAFLSRHGLDPTGNEMAGALRDAVLRSQLDGYAAALAEAEEAGAASEGRARVLTARLSEAQALLAAAQRAVEESATGGRFATVQAEARAARDRASAVEAALISKDGALARAQGEIASLRAALEARESDVGAARREAAEARATAESLVAEARERERRARAWDTAIGLPPSAMAAGGSYAATQAGGSSTLTSAQAAAASAEHRAWAEEKRALLARFNEERAALLGESKRLRAALDPRGAESEARLRALDEEVSRLGSALTAETAARSRAEAELRSVYAQWQDEVRANGGRVRELQAALDALQASMYPGPSAGFGAAPGSTYRPASSGFDATGPSRMTGRGTGGDLSAALLAAATPRAPQHGAGVGAGGVPLRTAPALVL